MSLEKAMLIVSNDIDVGSPALGIINKGKRDRDVNLHLDEYYVGKVEEFTIPMIVETFDTFGIPMTLAVRGQLAEVGGPVMDVLLASQVKHDIGSHGYTHRMFTELAHEEAENELRMISEKMKEYGITPRTFVFPRNCVAHLDLLEKYKYTCYRGHGNVVKDRMYIERCGRLYNVHPSICINQDSHPQMILKLLNIAIEKKLPLHIWFHFWNFGENKEAVSKTIKKLFLPFLQYAKKKQQNGQLTFETMLSAAQKVALPRSHP